MIWLRKEEPLVLAAPMTCRYVNFSEWGRTSTKALRLWSDSSGCTEPGGEHLGFLSLSDSS